MKTQNKFLVQIPFDGFYQSVTDAMIDSEIENYIYNKQEENSDYNDYPDYRVNFDYLAREYVKAYQSWMKENDYPTIALEFESMVSPREYNFTTDRIFCYVGFSDIDKLYSLFIECEDAQKIINDTFKSRDGLVSFYDDFCHEWKTKPLAEWDHNELMVLFPEPDYWSLWENPMCNGVFCNAVHYVEEE